MELPFASPGAASAWCDRRSRTPGDPTGGRDDPGTPRSGRSNRSFVVLAGIRIGEFRHRDRERHDGRDSARRRLRVIQLLPPMRALAETRAWMVRPVTVSMME